MLNPQRARWMYKRLKAQVSEVKASHLVYISEIDLHGIQPPPNGGGWRNSLHRGSHYIYFLLFFVFLGFRNMCLLASF
jgi:hypothetical protein